MELLLAGAVLAGLAWFLRGRPHKPAIWFDDAILRPEDLYAHGAELAKFQRVGARRYSSSLVLKRLTHNFRRITQVYAGAAEDLRQGREAAPAGEWLLDNYYVIEEQVREIQRSARYRSFQELPVLKNGQFRGLPRIFAIAMELILHTDGRLDEHVLVNFITAYQEEAQLNIAEIWALSLMVRIALVEKIRNSCTLLAGTHRSWRQAEEILANPDQMVEKIRAMKRLEPALVEHLLETMRRENLDSKAVQSAIADRLRDLDITLDKFVFREHQIEASRAASLGNAVTSLKDTATLDWNDIFETLCPVDNVLGADSVYTAMNFESRNYYRRQVQALARRTGVSETRIAKLAMECAGEAQGIMGHCGYYLLDRGRETILHRLGRRNKAPSFNGYVYIFALVILTLAAAFGAWAYARGGGLAALALVLALLPGSEVAVNLLNAVMIHLKRPAFLPKLEYREGIPEEAATLVVVPALLTDPDCAGELVRRLEVHYLANPEPNLYFALLGDFKDSSVKAEEADAEIAAAARLGIAQLNEKYGPGRFFLLLRKRSFSKTQNRWMGWERKRGALVELNALLAGVRATTFIHAPELPSVRYVLTLDRDTRLPLDMARKLAGTISHPLNRVELAQGRVVRGYGIIQPRIGVSVESTNQSFFARVQAGPGGTDTYTTAVSDVYQDWFGQGIFTGKGIYDVKAAARLLSDIPENSVLSHDLLEGGLLRTGLATDLELVDDFPAKYSAYTQRQHRWTRGDWQLLVWLGPKSPLGLLPQWQIFDNLRRSLMPCSLLLFLAAGLTVLSGSPLVWTGLFLTALFLPPVLSLIDYNWAGYWSNIAAGTRRPLADTGLFIWQLGLRLAFLPHQAWVNADAIVRTLYRVFVSRKNLLEWTTAAEAEKKEDPRKFLPAMAFLLALAVLVALLRPVNLFIYAPFLLLWLYAPRLSGQISGREEESLPRLGSQERKSLRILARKTWYYYQDLANEDSSFLPPDNIQIDPPNGIDARTSPTNIGLYLLSALAARDFGYISTLELVRRVGKALDSVESMRKWKGHLFNWYATRDLELLRPYFVSTVDSGNFICMLMTLAQGLREYLERPLLDAGLVRGLIDTLEVELFSPPEEISIAQWTELIADLSAQNHGRRFRQLLALFQEELDTLFPHTEIFNNPPAFLAKENYKELRELVVQARENPSPANLARVYREMLTAIDSSMAEASQEEQGYLLVLKDDVLRTAAAAQGLAEEINALVERIDKLVEGADFAALYNPKRHLFSIGYSVDEEKLTGSHYDLLASEARLTSYMAIVRRQVPVKHWYKQGRAETRIDGSRALVSWTGTMFEYLMPPLLQRNYHHTLLAETVQAVIRAQRSFARRRGLPWGISESGYYAFDYRLNYQYRAFGIPTLGLKRGLAQDMVVSSYSTLLALPFAPRAALDNLAQLQSAGLEGEYGLFEAVDYTPDRVPSSEGKGLVKSYMAHHQGMGLVALANSLDNFAMVRRFHADPRVQAGELLLQERAPLQPILSKTIREPVRPLAPQAAKDVEVVRSFGTPTSTLPNCHLLSNGSYSVLLTDSGSGWSRKEGIQISRWREDAPGLKYGSFIFIKSLNNDRIWSAAYAPLGGETDYYRVRFQPDRVSYFRENRNIDTRTDICVSSEEDAEIRQVVLTNHGSKAASLEVTSYLELALSHQGADLAHPAFNKLFIQTELIAEHNALLASRRPRSEAEPRLYALHQVSVQGEMVGSVQYETDRAKFLGRGRGIAWPAALHQPLSNSLGPVLDPVFSLRCQVRLGPGETCTIAFVTAQGTRAEMLDLADKYREPAAARRAFAMAYTRSVVERRFLNMDAELLEVCQQALGHLLFLSPTRRRHAEILARNTQSQPGLWAQGISGDNPIVLVNVADADEIRIVAEAVRAHEYWRFKGLTVDLVILSSEGGGYLEPVRDLIREKVRLSQSSAILDRPGGIFIRSASQLTEAERTLLMTTARLVLRGGRTFAEQLETEEPALPAEKQFSWREPANTAPPLQLPQDLQFFNGYGGFSSDGTEYVIMLGEHSTPAPWVNVLANPQFGCLISERGAGFSFAENSRENKLTPWSNDPVSDPPGEVIYVRDEESGAVWSAAAAPIREQEAYLISHGLGYSKFAHNSHSLSQHLTVFIPRDSVKLSLLRLKNHGDQKRRLTLTYYIRPVLGVSDQVSQQHIITAREGELITVRNPYNGDFPGRIVWLAASAPIASCTGDRAEFLGVQGDLAQPAALGRETLSNQVGAGFDPCAALQISITLEPGEEREVLFQLGQAADLDEAQKVSEKYTPKRAHRALLETQNYWRELTGTLTAQTPDLALNILLRWLVYQTIVCRLWARSGFYQSGGAFGFRDQLQDALNMADIIPEHIRSQILLHAAHQFQEGDVQHWWHPGTNNRGVRTRFTDDLLWLPYAAAEYIEVTGDLNILEEEIPFLEGKPLEEGEDERYGEAAVSAETASLYEHCRRAIKRALSFGPRGIPLMGSGDWNDGMNTVGNGGRGESIWLGWFLASILQRFAPLCRAKGDDALTEYYLKKAQDIFKALETQGWDGRWYRRAYFDDGTPLGSAENPECSIDSIAQSWAVIAGGQRRDRVEEAMDAVKSHLVKDNEGLILLFTPPFDNSDLKPGYIKGYVPGVRENGGQYTHAACWVIQAMAMLGRGNTAHSLAALINPVNHSRTARECATYKTEPYALAADVYSVYPHTGRGGWTWYTGAAGWLYRVCAQNILGVRRQGSTLVLNPCIPQGWREFTLNYSYGTARYTIHFRNPRGVSTGVAGIQVDGKIVKEVALEDDGKEHRVDVVMGL